MSLKEDHISNRVELGYSCQRCSEARTSISITWLHTWSIPTPNYSISTSSSLFARSVMQNPHPHAYGDGRFLHLQTAENEVVPVSGDSMIAAAGGNPTHDGGEVTWQNARSKAEILAHPLYEQLLSAHVACLRIATPVDQLPRIDAQLEQSQNVVAKYSVLGQQMMATCAGDDKELDQFMVCPS